jgi:hypothetical protein
MNYRINDPVLHSTPILDLRPTQMTLGMHEVVLKKKLWRENDSKDLEKFLSAHMVPAVLGPNRERYLIDHHHLVRALHEVGVRSVFVSVVADLHKLDTVTFWHMMSNRGWAHPFDNKGRRREYSDLPKTVLGMVDDPYRALAGELRNHGGFAKDSTPFSEFVWADFLRLNIKPKAIKQDFEAALKTALELSKSLDANYLPGWCAPHAKPIPPAKAKKKSAQDATARD